MTEDGQGAVLARTLANRRRPIPYVRKPNAFDELLVETSTTYEDVADLVGQAYDANRFSLQGAGWIGNGSFGLTVGLGYSTDPLANDPNFSPAHQEGSPVNIRNITPRPQVVQALKWTGSKPGSTRCAR